MMHALILPKVTKDRLSQSVSLQLACLNAASGGTAITEASCGATLDADPRFHGRGQSIAAWLWRAAPRYQALVSFSNGPVVDKANWVQGISADVGRFDAGKGSLSPHVSAKPPTWREHGADFLKNFYEDFRDGAGLPAILFTENASFGGQDFLRAFLAENGSLWVCPACERTIFYNQVSDRAGGSSGPGDRIGSQIDHYFPKSVYPHLAVHPLNLVPVCDHCNGTLVKGPTDPLKAGTGRRDISAVWLPYREHGLAKATYLEFNLGASQSSERIERLVERQGHNLRECIQAISDVYRIPDRWKLDAATIEALLFRRIRDYFAAIAAAGVAGSATDAAILEGLKKLMILIEKEQGTSPWAFTMTWWLTRLTKDFVKPVVQGQLKSTPFLKRVRTWSRPPRPIKSKSGDRAQELMDVIP